MKTPIACLCFVAALAAVARADELEAGFTRPPDAARPWVYWFWINGNISKEGLTADLEAMRRAGVGGALIMEVGETKHPQTRMAPAGPVAFGGPLWRERFSHVLAEAGRLGLSISMNNDAGWCGSGGPWNAPEDAMQRLAWSDSEVAGPRRFEADLPAPKGKQGYYRDVAVLAFPAAESVVAEMPAPARKGGRRARADAPAAPAAAVPRERVLDLTARLDASGRLAWDAPAGRWTVRRIGCVATGRMNHPAPAAGLGLECDKFSADAARKHFEAFIGKLADEAGPAAGKAFAMTHVDSWEVGEQDWTPRMAEEFRARRGYDLRPWLAALTGGPGQESEEVTRRFRRDFKKTQSELLVENYAGTLRRLANARGLRFSIEAYGPDGGFLNPLDYGAAADLPMAEFWVKRWDAWHLASPRLLASAAHAAGKAVIGAEAFTASPHDDPWSEHPYALKALGDWAFCEGVNRFVLHRMVHQPWLDREPGMSFGPFGTHFDRCQTWWEPGAAFMGYLARCQFLLQRGRFVADVCRLVPDGENYGARGTMAHLEARYAALPAGYNYDYVSEKALLSGAQVVNGRVTLPSGASYRVLQLPESDELEPELLRALRDLARAGADVAGPPPRRAPGLRGYPQCDDEVRALAAELWAGCNAANAPPRAFGAGRVAPGGAVADLLRSGVGAPDFTSAVSPEPTAESLTSVTAPRRGKGSGAAPAPAPAGGLRWIHRRDGEADLYFVANPQHRPVEARCEFRVAGKQPEFWDPETGARRAAAAFMCSGGVTRVPLRFTPAGSVFVVFREKEGRPAVAGANGQTFALVQEIAGPWQVAFDPARGGPVQPVTFASLQDWSRHPDAAVRYYSGTAVYRSAFEIPVSSFKSSVPRRVLDLGRVEVLAEVSLNGRSLGVLWKPPFEADVTGLLRPGRNELSVKVTNLWTNRLIGDERYPDDCTKDGSWASGALGAWPEWFAKGGPRPEPRRLTFTTWKYYAKDAPLLPSGLLGPVTVREEVLGDDVGR